MPGLRNPLQRIVGHMRRSTEQITGTVRAGSIDSRRATFDWDQRPGDEAKTGFVDLTIHFIGAMTWQFAPHH